MYHKILVPLDEREASRLAAGQALRLAHAVGAEVVFIVVLDQHVTLEIMPLEPGDDFYAMMTEESDKSSLYALQHEATRLGVRATTLIRYNGHPAEQILYAAQEAQVDLIVMASRSKGVLTSLLLGSVADEVVRKAPCPVQVHSMSTLARLGNLAGLESESAPHVPASEA